MNNNNSFFHPTFSGSRICLMIISIKTLQYCRKIVINWCLKLIHADIHSRPSTWDMKILKCSWNIATKLKLIFLSFPWCEDDAMVYKLQITVINLLKHRTAVCRAEFLTRSILLLLSLLYPPSTILISHVQIKIKTSSKNLCKILDQNVLHVLSICPQTWMTWGLFFMFF